MTDTQPAAQVDWRRDLQYAETDELYELALRMADALEAAQREIAELRAVVRHGWR